MTNRALKIHSTDLAFKTDLITNFNKNILQLFHILYTVIRRLNHRWTVHSKFYPQ